MSTADTDCSRKFTRPTLELCVFIGRKAETAPVREEHKFQSAFQWVLARYNWGWIWRWKLMSDKHVTACLAWTPHSQILTADVIRSATAILLHSFYTSKPQPLDPTSVVALHSQDRCCKWLFTVDTSRRPIVASISWKCNLPSRRPKTASLKSGCCTLCTLLLSVDHSE